MSLRIVKPSTEAQRATHTTLDTIVITPAIVNSWKNPEFQREKRVNERVMELARDIRSNDGVIPGVITIGVIGGDRFLVDGQHRREAFLLSECKEGYVDVRILHVRDMAALATEFYELNSRLVNMRPDDYLRALEKSSDELARLRKRCPFVGFDNVRRGDKSPVLSMSAVLRCWWSSGKDVPQPGGLGATTLAAQFTAEDCDGLIGFLELAFAAWGRDKEFHRLWGNANMTLCMWLFRRLVITQWSDKTPKIGRELFQKLLMALSAESTYLDWLVGRNLTERDRAPALGRIKTIFARRIEEETGKKPRLPQPSWATH